MTVFSALGFFKNGNVAVHLKKHGNFRYTGEEGLGGYSPHFLPKKQRNLNEFGFCPPPNLSRPPLFSTLRGA